MTRRKGFTLIELLVVMAIIATLLAIAAPRYFNSLDRARDASLRETLFVIRDAIDKYHYDIGRYPGDLEELVDKRYLRKLPQDPITESSETWVLVPPPDGAAVGDLYDIRSGAPGGGADGIPYSEW
ncbi:MAG: prepilin-type N-terminal cleavage/methylation domain-containing protein [Rhodocyclales bacterium]|nr:prepilin-type N-terminal cleavage/methylation domain-containing protein [Rhodocyclales bacterium]